MSHSRRSAMALGVSSEPPLTIDTRSFHLVRLYSSIIALLSFTDD